MLWVFQAECCLPIIIVDALPHKINTPNKLSFYINFLKKGTKKWLEMLEKGVPFSSDSAQPPADVDIKSILTCWHYANSLPWLGFAGNAFLWNNWKNHLHWSNLCIFCVFKKNNGYSKLKEKQVKTKQDARSPAFLSLFTTPQTQHGILSLSVKLCSLLQGKSDRS